MPFHLMGSLMLRTPVTSQFLVVSCLFGTGASHGFGILFEPTHAPAASSANDEERGEQSGAMRPFC
jgi:hypothetical protein